MKSIVIRSVIVGLVLTLISFAMWGVKGGLGSLAGATIIIGDTLAIGWLTKRLVQGAQAAAEGVEDAAPDYFRLVVYGLVVLAKFAIIFLLVGLAVRYLDPAGVIVGLTALFGGVIWYMLASVMGRGSVSSS